MEYLKIWFHLKYLIFNLFNQQEFQFDLKTILILLQLVYKYTVLFYPSVMMEMITDQLDALKIQIADRMITCTCKLMTNKYLITFDSISQSWRRCTRV